MESFLKSFERREEKNSFPRGRRFLFKEGRKIGEETMNRLYRITINRSKKRMENNSWKPFERREEKNSLPGGGRFVSEEGRKIVARKQ